MKRGFTLLVLLLILCVILINGCSDQLNNPVLNELEIATDDIDQYRSRQNEIILVDLGTLSRFVGQILASEPDLSNTELRAKLFDELVRLNNTPRDSVATGPPFLPGYGYPLTWEEFWLLLKHPRYIFSTYKTSLKYTVP